MNRSYIHTNVFIKPPVHSDDATLNREKKKRAQLLDDMATDVMHNFDIVTKAISERRLSYKKITWPEPQSDELIIQSSSSGTLNYLESPAYDADIGLFMIEDLAHIDPAVGRIMNRKRQYLYICICTIEALPDKHSQKGKRLYNNILTVPTESSALRSSPIGLQIPYPHGELGDWSQWRNVQQQGKLGIIDVENFSQNKIEGIVTSVLLEKLQM